MVALIVGRGTSTEAKAFYEAYPDLSEPCVGAAALFKCCLGAAGSELRPLMLLESPQPLCSAACKPNAPLADLLRNSQTVQRARWRGQSRLTLHPPFMC